MTPLHLCRDEGSGDAAVDTAIARALLERVDAGELPATLRLSRPQAVVAFSRQDAAAPGFPAAVAAAGAAGFEGVLRLAGGRAAVFHPGTIAFSWAVPAPQPIDQVTGRFRTMADVLTDALRACGADAHVGEIPGEYCAGQWSINIGHERKVAGIGQRLLRRAAHTGGVVVVSDADAIVRVLTPERLRGTFRCHGLGPRRAYDVPRPSPRARTPSGGYEVVAAHGEILEGDRAYVASGERRAPDVRPARHLAVITCMDARIAAFPVLGLDGVIEATLTDPQATVRKDGQRLLVGPDRPDGFIVAGYPLDVDAGELQPIVPPTSAAPVERPPA